MTAKEIFLILNLWDSTLPCCSHCNIVALIIMPSSQVKFTIHVHVNGRWPMQLSIMSTKTSSILHNYHICRYSCGCSYHPKEGHWKFWVGRGFQKRKVFNKENMKLNWNFQEGKTVKPENLSWKLVQHILHIVVLCLLLAYEEEKKKKQNKTKIYCHDN